MLNLFYGLPLPQYADDMNIKKTSSGSSKKVFFILKDWRHNRFYWYEGDIKGVCSSIDSYKVLCWI